MTFPRSAKQISPQEPLIQGAFFKTHDWSFLGHHADADSPLIQGAFSKTHDRKTIYAVFPVSSRHICERLPKTTFLLRSFLRL